MQLQRMATELLEGEKHFEAGTSYDIRAALGMSTKLSVARTQGGGKEKNQPKKNKPGKRKPQRDPVGMQEQPA